jgi:hypothetical protein
MSLSKTAFDCSKTGLEYLNLLVTCLCSFVPRDVPRSDRGVATSLLQVIQKPANANFFLSARGWQKWFVDLLMGHDAGSKQAPQVTVLNISICANYGALNSVAVSFLCQLQPQDKDVILKLSLNIIACIHYQHFATHQSSEEIDPSKQDPVPNMASLLMGTVFGCRCFNFRCDPLP